MAYDFKVCFTPKGSDECIEYAFKRVQTGAGGECVRVWVPGGLLSNSEDEMVFDTMEEALGAIAAEIHMAAEFCAVHNGDES
jgi:hypothetical protein